MGFAPDTVWLHAELTCQMGDVSRGQLHRFFMWFGDGHMDEDPMVQQHLHDFELGVNLAKGELCFSASAAFCSARMPGGFMLSRAAYQTNRRLLYAAQEALHFQRWGPWTVTEMVATVWNSDVDEVVMSVNYTPDLRTERFNSDQYLSVLLAGYGCRSMSGVYACWLHCRPEERL